MSIYTGYEYYTLTNKQLSAFYKDELDSNQFDLFENEYLIITDKKKEVIDYGIKKGDKIKKDSPKLIKIGRASCRERV